MKNRDNKNYPSVPPHWTQKAGFYLLVLILILAMITGLSKRDYDHMQEMVMERDQHIQQLERKIQSMQDHRINTQQHNVSTSI